MVGSRFVDDPVGNLLSQCLFEGSAEATHNCRRSLSLTMDLKTDLVSRNSVGTS